MGKLTAKGVAAEVAKGQAQKLNDGEGLTLRIAASKKASWVYRFTMDGKTREMGLGSFPDVSLADARTARDTARISARTGTNPLEEKRQHGAKRLRAMAEQEAARKRDLVTFERAALDYIDAHAHEWSNAKHRQQWHNTLSTYAFPVIGDIKPQDITTANVLEVLKPIWNTKQETAARVRNRIELVLDAAKAQGLRTGENPAAWRGNLQFLLSKRKKADKGNHAAMPAADVPATLAALLDGNDLSNKALALTILTACRTGEVIAAQWDEFDLAKGIWTIPAERMKADRVHTVQLSTQAAELVATLPRIDGNPYLFAGRKKGSHISNMALEMVMRRQGWKPYTVHGFRSTFRNWCANHTTQPSEILECCLAHVVQGTEGHYWRDGAPDRQRMAWQAWADHCTTKPASNVVRLERVQ